MTTSVRPLWQLCVTRCVCLLVLVASALPLVRPPTATAATFTVTKTSDSKDGACTSDCSLREAVIAAHQQPGADTIMLAAGTYRLTLSDLDITSSLKIVGAGVAATIIESNGYDRVLEVRPDITVTIDKVTIRNGKLRERGDGAGILNMGALTLTNSTVSRNVSMTGAGGGIANMGALTLTNSTVSNNESAGSGGGIMNGRTLTLTNSTISDNMSDWNAGGIYNTGTLTLTDSTVNHNHAQNAGGGMENDGRATIIKSTFHWNITLADTSYGGAVANNGVLTLVNSTISGNSIAAHGAGGGIYNRDVITVLNSTLMNNWANDEGGGIDATSVSSTTLSNTIIAGNHSLSGADCAGSVQSQGYNLMGDARSCTITGDTTGNRLNVDPQLGALQYNGGPTLTHLPASGSPVIDAGSPAAPGGGGNACATTDQRGQTRPKDGNGDGTARCDIGAVER